MRIKLQSSQDYLVALDELSPSEELEVKLMAIAYDKVEDVSKLISDGEVIKGRQPFYSVVTHEFQLENRGGRDHETEG